jgi:hypothetical protein
MAPLMSSLRILCVFGLTTSLALAPQQGVSRGGERLRVVVELSTSPPSAVAIHEARVAGSFLDRDAAEVRVQRSQDEFLRELRSQGIDFVVTQTPVQVKGGVLWKPDRFGLLINAIGLSVRRESVERIRAMEGVKHVSPEEELELQLDHSVRYIRANDGPGNKTIFSQGGGALERFDGSGQVIAILDTGVEHTHPAFDTRFSDADYLMRTGDARPVRLAGEPYQEGVHHPKVVYYLSLTASTNEDDVGHGTHCATDSAGVKVKGPGLDRIPGNADDQVIEGVAPGALLMAYKLCETTFTCAGTLNIITALEDALSPTDPAGNPKPVATVINMSFGGGSGDPDAPTSVAVDNAALLGAVMVASAGNSGPGEGTIGAPAAARRAIAVAAASDPGAIDNESDVLAPDPLRYGTVASTGAQNDTGRPPAAQDVPIRTIIMGGSPDVTFPLGQHYVYVGVADTPDQVPAGVAGRIALAARGSTVDLGATGTGAFANKAAECASQGAIALLVFNNVDGELEGTTAEASVIPVYGISRANGLYLRDALGFQSALFDPENSSTWNTISDFPIRIDPPDPSTFVPDTTGFSSRGPIGASAYIKPDVTAPGFNVYSATIAAGGVSTGGGTMSAPSRFISASGTSFSGPHVTGSAALLRQALLDGLGVAPIPPADLRSGAGADEQQAQATILPQSIVRAALENTATNLRASDNVTPLADSDDRNFIHEIGAGLIHVAEAVDARAVMGTNNRNGTGGPDAASDADFLPTHSFGEVQSINSARQHQVRTVTVTLENVTGATAGGSYSLSLLDGGALRGTVTRPIVGTTGFDVSLTTPSVVLGSSPGDRVTFDVRVDVDGRSAPLGLDVAGADTHDNAATEFRWWVVANGSNGEHLRMPFAYHAVAKVPETDRVAPTMKQVEDDSTPDQTQGGVDRDGKFRLRWSYPVLGVEQPCAFVVEQASFMSAFFTDDAEDPLVLGENGTWIGEADWVTSPNPDTNSNSYHPLYTDEVDLKLAMIAPIALPHQRVTLSYTSSEDLETGHDFARVEASGNGGPFLPVANFTGGFSGIRRVDLTGFAGQDVRVRFRFVTDDSSPTTPPLGWFIDNITLSASDFHSIGTFSGEKRTLLVNLQEPRLRITDAHTSFFRVLALFGNPCTTSAPPSNERAVVVDPGEKGPF